MAPVASASRKRRPAHAQAVATRGSRQGNDDFGQPRILYELVDDGPKARLHVNIAATMQGVPADIVDRRHALFDQVRPDHAAGVARALGHETSDLTAV